MGNQSRRFSLIVLAAAVCACAGWAQSGSKQRAPTGATKPAERASGAEPSCLAALASGDFAPSAAALRLAFEELAATCDPARPDGLREAALGARLGAQLAGLDAGLRAVLLTHLRVRADACAELAFLLDPEHDDAAAAWALFDRARRERPKDAERLPGLLAALCVVRDRPLERRINENVVTATDPVGVFGHFAANEGKMVFSLRDTPPELLVYVVDATASPEEMAWALGRYARSADVGAKFFDVQYDLEAFYRGTDKKVTEAGYTLQNIFRHGGVCADQAYFATSVGKAIGAPSAYVVGRAAQVGHAWVGFLDGNARNARWNFDAGRYDEFKNNLGRVENPQTGAPMADSELGLLAELLGVKPSDRHEAVALADAAALFVEPGANAAKPDARATDRALALLEASLRKNAACIPAWSLLGRLAAQDRLTIEHKRKWAEAVRRLCGNRYPDFALDALTPMVETIDDPKEQGRIWNALFMDFGKRADLGARIRLAEARMWERSGDSSKALSAYMEVVDRYANVGPAAVDALIGAKTVLFSQKRQDQALALLESTWKRLPRPDGAARFASASNWHRAGVVFAMALQDAGRAKEAERVAADLGLARR